MKLYALFLLVLYFKGTSSFNASLYEFADNFSFGVATSAYQVEGAWNVTGKGIGFWDYVTHNAEIIADGSNGDIACNSYYKTDEDVALLKELGVQHYRFSISWTRILPTGRDEKINWEGVAYYDDLIDKLLAAGIEPWVTMFHFDHPYNTQLLGGWFQPKMVDYLRDYANILFHLYGDRVKTWITINEPWGICVPGNAALGSLVPLGVAEYLCGQNILKAHAAVYNLYVQKYKSAQNGKISMAFNLQAHLPATDSLEDIKAVERVNEFHFGWLVHPLVFGDYPPVMRSTIDFYSKQQGFKDSRLPYLSKKDLRDIKGSYDFIGLNTYDTFIVSDNRNISESPSFTNDYGATLDSPAWNMSYSIEMRAKGLGVTLNWIKENYNNPEIRMTEQGFPEDTTDLEDVDRHSFIVACIAQLLKSVFIDKVNVTGYTFWSFMDNFEWSYGYTKKYGLYNVDFDDDNRPRTPRLSSSTFSLISTSRSLKGLV